MSASRKSLGHYVQSLGLLARFLAGMLFGLGIVSVVQATVLVDMFDATLRAEPNYLGAKANFSAVEQKAVQARATAFLPQLSASVGSNLNHRRYTTKTDGIDPISDTYNSHTHQLNFSQPLWNQANYVGWQQSALQLEQARQHVIVSEQAVVLKLIDAWFEVLSARDRVMLAWVQLDLAKDEWEMAAQAMHRGIVSGVNVTELEARYQQARVEHQNAQRTQVLKLSLLTQLVGQDVNVFKPMLQIKLPYQLNAIPSESLDYWLDRVEALSPEWRVSLLDVELAAKEIRKQSASHLPTVELSGSYGSNTQNVGNFPGQHPYKIDQQTIGVQVNMPLYTGGATQAKVVEAMAMKEKAAQQLEVTRRTLREKVQESWYALTSAQALYLAQLNLLKAQELNLEAARMGGAKGIKTKRDIGQAEQAVEKQRVETQKTLYDALSANIKLKAAAGQVERSDLEALEHILTSDSQKALVLSEKLPH